MSQDSSNNLTRQLTLFNTVGGEGTQYVELSPPPHTLHPSFTSERYSTLWWRDRLCCFVYERIAGNKPKILKYIHEYPNSTFTVNITPAILENKNGDVTLRFPTGREESVYQAIRYIATNKRKSAFLKLSKDIEDISDISSIAQAAIYTSKNEIKEYLSSINKTLSINEINEALSILTKSILEINYNGVQICNEPYINIKNRYREAEIGKRNTENIVIRFPEYESTYFFYDVIGEFLEDSMSKETKTMRQIAKEKASALNPRELQVYRYLMSSWLNANYRHSTIKISETERLKDMYGTTVVTSKMRTAFVQVLKRLIEHDIIEYYEEDLSLRVKDRQKIVDRVWCLHASKTLITDIKAANAFAKRRKLSSKDEFENYIDMLHESGTISKKLKEQLINVRPKK